MALVDEVKIKKTYCLRTSYLTILRLHSASYTVVTVTVKKIYSRGI